jgi:hypothetical protein
MVSAPFKKSGLHLLFRISTLRHRLKLSADTIIPDFDYF